MAGASRTPVETSRAVSTDPENRLPAVTSRARLSALMRRCYAPPFLCPAISLIAPTVAGGRVDAIGLDGTGHRACGRAVRALAGTGRAAPRSGHRGHARDRRHDLRRRDGGALAPVPA